MCYIKHFLSPVGYLTVKSNGNAITDICLGLDGDERPDVLSEKAVNELELYFDGVLKEFTFPISLHGTDFQIKVWQELEKIPYGVVVSYGDIAEKLGGKRYSRAVGGAVHKNPLLIAIPCHRVISSDGSIGGFACGLTVKKHLLHIEDIKYS